MEKESSKERAIRILVERHEKLKEMTEEEFNEKIAELSYGEIEED